MSRWTGITTLFGVATFVLAATVSLTSRAASPNDGNWVIDFPADGFNVASGSYNCPALRIVIKINESHVSGNIERTAGGQGSGGLRSSQAAQGSPIVGTVTPDGAVQAKWEKYSLKGKLANGTGTVTTSAGQCGPRKGTAVRVAG